MSRSFGLVPTDKSYQNFSVAKTSVTQKRAVGKSAIYETLSLAGHVQQTSDPATSSPYTVVWPPNLPAETTDVLGVAGITAENKIALDWQAAGTGNNSAFPSQYLQVSPEFIPATPGKQYSSLAAAIAYVTAQSPGPSNRWTVHMYPGTYVEPATVVIPSFVTLTADFSLSVVLQTSGTSHVLHASNRCDIYNLVIQGPTATGAAGIFADDVDIGFFVGNVRFVGCDYGMLLQPAANKTVFAYVRNCLFNGNLTNQIFADSSNTGSILNAFFWNNVIYAPSAGLVTDTFGPLVRVKGGGTRFQSYANDYERDESNVLGIAIQLQDAASFSSSGSSYNWFTTGVSVVNDSTASSLILSNPRFFECTINLNMANSNTTGYLSGANEFLKTLVTQPTAFFVNNSLPTTITVGSNGSADFTDLVAAVAYVTSQVPSGSNRFIIEVAVGNYSVNQTLTIPSYCDLLGNSFTQTSITITTANTDLIHAGYSSRIADISLWGYGTNPSNPNFAIPTGITSGYGILYTGSADFSLIGYLENVQLGNFYKGIGVITNPGLYNILQFQTLRFRGYVNTNTCIEINAGSGGATSIGLRNSRYSPTFINLFPGNFTNFLSMTADSPSIVNNLVADTVNIVAGGTDTGTPSGNPLKYGTGFLIQQGNFSLQNAKLLQLDKGVHITAGTSPIIEVTATNIKTCNTGLLVESTTASGAFQGIMDRLLVQCISPNIGILLTEQDGNGSVIIGGLYQSPTSYIQQGTTSVATNLSPQLNQGGTVGVVTGGIVTVSGSNVSVTSGTGYVMNGTPPNDVLQFVQFGAQSQALVSNQNNYVYVDINGSLLVSTSAPNTLNFMLLGRVVMNGSAALYVDQGVDSLGSQTNIRHLASDINTALQTQFGAIVVSGLIFTNPSALQLAMTQGQYYVGAENFTPSAVAGGSAFIGLYNGSGAIQGTWAATSLTAVPLQWNNNGVLTALTAGQFAKHSVYVSGESTNQQLFLLYSQQTYASSNLADIGPLPLVPTFFSPNVVLCAAVVTDNTSIIHILDQRPTLVSRSNTIVATNNHSNLINLGADDHLQYFRTDGTRLMTGSINTNNNNIIVGTGLVDGVTVHAHASRHVPGGADPLPTAAPVTISALTNAEGVAGTFARSDHIHAHGTQTDPTLHAIASGSANGFMSAADKTIFDAATPLDSINTLVKRSGTGTFQCRGVSLYDSGGAAGVSLVAKTATTPYTLTYPGNAGSSNQVLVTDGTGVTSWVAVTPSLFSGVLPIANGGTNSSTALNNNRIMVSSGNAITEAAALTNGQILIGNSGNAPTAATLTAGSNVSITNGAGSITIAASGVFSTNRAFAYDTTTQTVASANVFQDIVFSNNVVLSGWTHVAGSANFVCGTSGDYLVSVTSVMNCTTGGATRRLEIIGVNNGNQVAGSQIFTTISTNNSPTTVSGTFIVSMIATQILKLQLTGPTTASQLLPGTGSATVKPSISMTINQIA